MRPNKRRMYCQDCGRQKILFESEKKAKKFIEFNSSEIESESGCAPNRSYFCIVCNGWHVTSKKEVDEKSRTEYVLELFKEEKEKKALWRAQKAAIKKQRNEILNERFNKIEQYINQLGRLERTDINFALTLALAVKELEMINRSSGMRQKKIEVEKKLQSFGKRN